jgi:hypothetical protein
MQTGSDLGFSWIYFAEENSWSRSTGHGSTAHPGPLWTGAARHRGRGDAWPARGATVAMTHRRGRAGRGDGGEANAGLTEARALAKRRCDGDGGRRCFGDGEGVRERGKEWGRCGDRQGATRPIYKAGGRSTRAGNSVTASGKD